MNRALPIALTLISSIFGLVATVGAQPSERIRVAVMPFDAPVDHSKLAPLGKSLADMMATDLAQSPDLTLVERERIADIKEEIRLGASGAVDKRTAARAGHLLGADAVVVGAITVVGEALRIDARVVATGSGEVLAAAHADGKIETFFEVEATVARELLKALGAVLTPIARMRLGKPATRSLQAALAYGSALDASDRGDAAAARIALAEAVAADPDFAAAKERLAKLERRLDALERRTAEVEVAGGRILKPTSALDHLHNATLADERGERAQALADLRHVLKERPWAVAALTLWAKSTADDSQIAAAARPLAAALRAIAAADVAAAQLTERFTVHEQPTTAEQRAGAWIRLLALDALAHRCAAGAKPHCLAAEERSERAALALWLANTPQDRAVFPRQDDVRAAETHLLAARDRGNADVVAHAAVGGPASTFRRATLLARPVAVATPERVGRSMPWLSLQVRVMDAGSRAVNAVLRIGDGAGVRTLRLALVPVIPSPWGEEAGLFAAPLPQAFAQACRPQDKMRVAIDRIDPRGQRRATDLVVPAPRVWGGNWRALGAGVGRNIANTYPMHGVRLAVLGSGARKAASFRILVNAAASVWATVAHVAELDRDDDAAISWSPLWGGVAGPLASGAAQLRHTDDGGHSAGLILPLVVLYADAPIALGSARVVRRFERDGSWHYDTAARAGWMDGGLDGSAAPLDIDVTVAALLAAGRVDLASLALDEAATGVDVGGRMLWLSEPAHAAALALLQSATVAGKPPSSPSALGPSSTPATVAVPGFAGVVADAQEVSVDAYAACVASGRCSPLLDDHCHNSRYGDDEAPLRGDQPARCLTALAPNPYPVTWVRQREAAAYCLARGGRLPTLAEWRALAGGHGQRGNTLDAVACIWRHFGRQDPLPAECNVQRALAAVGDDGAVWWAPTTTPSPADPYALLGNVREWVAAPAGAKAAGCSATMLAPMQTAPDLPATTPITCSNAIGDVVGSAAADVGFRCAYDATPKPITQRGKPKKPAMAPKLKWLRVDGGAATIGGMAERPSLTWPNPSAAAIAAVAAELAGVDVKRLKAFTSQLNGCVTQGVLSAAALEGLIERGRWQRISAAAALSALTKLVCDADDVAAVALHFAPNIESTRRRLARAKNSPTLGQALFDQAARELTRDALETPKHDGVMVWDEQHAQLCDDRRDADCDDATGTASNRVTARTRAALPVFVSPFELLETEVTGAQFAAVVGYDPSHWPCSDCAVERVSWREASAFCAAIGGALPTEAQWTRAVRGDAITGRYGPINAIAHHRGDGAVGKPTVGGRSAAPFGHRDLLGGQWEWLADHWADGWSVDVLTKPAQWTKRSYYDREGPDPDLVCLLSDAGIVRAERTLATLPFRAIGSRKQRAACFADEATGNAAVAALIGRDPLGPAAQGRNEKHTVVGGSWQADTRLLYAAARVGFGAGLRSPYIGFRCARSVR